jgi:hypothetical protein
MKNQSKARRENFITFFCLDFLLILQQIITSSVIAKIFFRLENQFFASLFNFDEI